MFWRNEYGKDDFADLIKKGHIIDGRKGGLILGQSHEAGGIYVYQFNEDHFIWDAEIEGNEYYVNRYSFESNEVKVREINEYYPQEVPKPININYSHNVRIIDARGFRKALFLAGGMVVNADASEKYLHDLERINQQFNKNWLSVEQLFRRIR